jgi:hypothetical protein
LIDHANQIQQRRFSAARRPNDRNIVSTLDIEGHTLKRVNSFRAQRIVATHIAQRDDRHFPIGAHQIPARHNVRAHAIASRRSHSAIGNDAARHAG